MPKRHEQPSKHIRNYIVTYKSLENETVIEQTSNLVQARYFANSMNRHGRFVSLININGIKLTL